MDVSAVAKKPERRLSADHEAELQRVFAMVDSSRDGAIDDTELHTLMVKLTGSDVTMGQVRTRVLREGEGLEGEEGRRTQFSLQRRIAVSAERLQRGAATGRTFPIARAIRLAHKISVRRHVLPRWFLTPPPLALTPKTRRAQHRF